MVSYGWASFRIITGTILGGILGFYVMHRLDNSYKEKMKERLIKYEQEKKQREEMLLGETEQSELLPDS